jgi:molybdate transport system regulatory protein
MDRQGKIRFRLILAPGVVLGPGKIDLLAGIAETGSISAAGRAMEMSYKKAWSLVDELNHGFAEPLVEAAKGGKAGGGARLTDAGRKILDTYRDMERRAADHFAGDLDRLHAMAKTGARTGAKAGVRTRRKTPA